MNRAPAIPTKERQSNFEALRIVCALMIVFLHANFWTLGKPTWEMLCSQPAAMLARVFFQFICAPATYAFILLSGYFGIRVKPKGVANLLFMLLFWKGVLIVRQGVVDGWSLSLMRHANPFIGWFIPAYITLMCFVPALNAFADSLDRPALSKYLLVLIPIVMALDCLRLIDCFNGGYSAPALMMAYLIGRYLGKTPQTKERFKLPDTASGIAWLYLGLVLVWIGAFCLILFVLRDHPAFAKTMTRSLGMYTSPVSLTGSVLLFMLFAKLKIQSRFVNWIALSAFPIIGYHLFFGYQDAVRGLYARYEGWTCLAAIACYGLIVSFGIIILDQVRILTWRKIVGAFFKLGEAGRS